MTAPGRTGRTAGDPRSAASEGASALRTARPGLGLPGPRRAAETWSRSQLTGLSLPLGDDGVLAGTDTAGDPVVLGLFRPTPLDAVVIGSVWTAQLLAVRAVEAGAEVSVESARPRLWAPLASGAAAGRWRLTVYGVEEVPHREPGLRSPVLVVRDCGAQPPPSTLARAPWQAALTLLPFLGPQAGELAAEAELVGVQRVSPQEAEVLAGTLRLDPQQTAALPGLDDDAVLWCTARHRRFARLAPAPDESQLLGEARRID
ncbi:hypothetical protein [Streptomyces sp. NPDC021224]|uniref:hypothetical protein n=1 Tax=unclassified Streptomyces TaxID=2593676 RepID=UPI0037A56EAD